MISLSSLVRSYLESAEYKILSDQDHCLIAHKIFFGSERESFIVWTVPPDIDPGRYESTLRASISTVRANYPGARAYVLAPSRGGFSRDMLELFRESRIKFLVPIQFFDTTFKVEEASKAASAIADIRLLAKTEQRIQQSFKAEASLRETDGEDLFNTLSKELSVPNSATLRIIVGRAGIGKSFLFRALFAHLYEDFVTAKSQHGKRPRPIPLVPEHLKGTYVLRTEALIDNFLRTDVASPVTRETFEWLLVNGFAIWLLDGLDELYAGDPYFFEYLEDVMTRKDSKAQIVIWCRDSLLTTSDAFANFRMLCGGTDMLKIYRLSEWERAAKRDFTWLALEERRPKPGENDSNQVTEFLGDIDRSPTLRSLSGLPFYCDLLLRQFRQGQLKEISDDVALLNFVIDQMIQREIDKGLIDLNHFESGGLQDWLEEIARSYVEDQRYAGIDRSEAREYGEVVLRSGLDENLKQNMLISLLQFPLFRAGAETGLIAFTHDLIAQALAARAYVRAISKRPADVGERLSHTDLEDPTLLRFMARQVTPDEESKIVQELQQGTVQGRGIAILLSLLMMVRPGRDEIKRVKSNLDSTDLIAVRFEDRDLSGVSFRSSDLSHAVFKNCDLRGAHFEGTFLNRTRFEGDNQLQDAGFGDLSRIHSLWVRNKFVEDPTQIREWIAQVTGRRSGPEAACPAAQQLFHLFGKFITPLGKPRRDKLKHAALTAGKRYGNAPDTQTCVDAAVRYGYLTGPDARERFRRAEGDKYAEMVKFVRDSSISDGLGLIIRELCLLHDCMHRLSQ